MDPARYARVFGVQSESNRGTVTRVASNEIVYRRAVDTYRRDMASTVTSIHREQKRLKRNMRAYRRRIRETQNLTSAKKRKPFKIGWIAYESESSFFDFPTRKRKNRRAIQNHNEHDQNTQNKQSDGISTEDKKPGISLKLQGQIDDFLKTVDDHMNGLHVRKQPMDENDLRTLRGMDKAGRRRFLFGASDLVTSEELIKELELEGFVFDDSHGFASDNSSDEEGDDTEKAARKLRHKRPIDMLRLNSAYFKAIEFEKKAAGLEIDRGGEAKGTVVDSLVDGTVSVEINSEQTQGSENTTVLPQLPQHVPPSIPNGHGTSTMQLQPITISNSQNTAKTDLNNDHLPSKLVTQEGISSKRQSNRIDFGDLIRFKHGMNTKKLLSMVDKLASRYGKSDKDTDTTRHNTSFKDAVHRAYRPLPNIVDSVDGRPLPNPGVQSDKKILETFKLKNRITGIERADGTAIAVDKTTGQRNKNHHQPAKQDVLGLSNQKDLTSKDKSIKPSLLPDIAIHSPLSHSHLSDDGTTSVTIRNRNDTSRNALNASSRGSDIPRNRPSSILDNSNYISNMRRRSIIQEHDKILRDANGSDKIGQRRRLAKLKKEPIVSEHKRVADDKKITWSSALGQMKLVHTIADVTNFV